MEKRYGRAQFLRDGLSLGLPTHLAFSRTALRRRRDQLIREHHPDRGGSHCKAQEINEIYTRMIRWLDSRYKPGTRLASEAIDEPEPHGGASSQFLRKAGAAALWAATALASGYIAARKRKFR